MTKEDILQDLAELFSDIFDNESLGLNMDTKAKDIEEWDSLAHIRIVVAIERKFGIKLSIEEMSELNEVKAIVELINVKLNAHPNETI